MKASKSKQPDRVKLSVTVVPHLKQRLEEVARQDGVSVEAWVLKTIEARLAVRVVNSEDRGDAESVEYEQEQKLDDIRAMRETW